MRCRDVLRLSSGYIDGELDERRSSAVRGHLRTCGDCAAAVEKEAVIRDAACELDASVEPPPSLWAGIEQQLASEEIADSGRSRLWLLWPRLRSQLPYAAVAIAAAAALLLWLTADRRRPAQPERHEPRIAVQRTSIQPEPAAAPETRSAQTARQIREAEARYLTAIAELRTAAAGERGHWSAERAAELDARVSELDRGIRAEKRALRAAGGADLRARRRLHSLYQQEIDLLMEASLDPGEQQLAEARP